MKRNIWLDGMMGVIVGDALGCPVQFIPRAQIAGRASGPVTGMEEGGTYQMPKGTWTDDSSMALATLASIRELGAIHPDDIMERFVDWYEDGEYTPFGYPFDMGTTCSMAIEKYERQKNTATCGGTSEHSNGNGSLMRIMPACLYAYDRNLSAAEAVRVVHIVGGLTHNHLRAKIACGLYCFCVKAVLDEEGTLPERIQKGLNEGFAFYEQDAANAKELSRYARLRDVQAFGAAPVTEIRSSGYVVDSLEAAIWSLVRSGSFRECLLSAVNLGEDTDTIGAIAGGLAALYYSYDAIPADWLAVIRRREWIEDLYDFPLRK